MLRYLALLLSFTVTAAYAGGYDNAPVVITPPPIATTPVAKSGQIIPPPAEPVATTSPRSYHTLTATVNPGSVKENIQRIAADWGWPQVVWNVPYDYRWVGTTQIRASSLAELLNTLLDGYPLQAVFYKGNHILVINPRILK